MDNTFDKQIIENYHKLLGISTLHMDIDWVTMLLSIYDLPDKSGNLYLYNLEVYSPLEAIGDFLSKFSINLNIKIIQ